MKILFAILIGLALLSEYAYAAPQTADDYIGWTVAIVVFLWLLAQAIKSWRDVFSDIKPSNIFLFNWLRGTATPDTPMLLICGDESFCDNDELQLVRAGIEYRKFEHATLTQIEGEFQRRRLDGTLYPWVHISAHGTVDGWVLSSGIMTAEWAARHFRGVRILFAASCDSQAVGDVVHGIVASVVVVYGARGSGAISTFAGIFWSEMARSGDVKAAYLLAREKCPELRNFVDLRMK